MERIPTGTVTFVFTDIEGSTQRWEAHPEAMRTAFAVFAGGFALDAAEAICADEQITSIDVADLLFRLVGRSLVNADERGEQVRYHMLATLLEYASEKLEASTEAARYRENHGEYFLKLAEEAEAALTGTGQAAWLERLEAEHDNLRAAIRWAVRETRAEMAQVLAGEGHPSAAARVQGATSKLLESLGAPLEPYEQALYEKTAGALKRALSPAGYEQALDAGRTMSLEQAIDFALRPQA